MHLVRFFMRDNGHEFANSQLRFVQPRIVLIDTDGFALVLEAGGRYVTVGGHVPRLLQAFFIGPLVSVTSSKRVRIVALKPNRDPEQVNTLFEKGKLRSVIDGPYALSEVPQAIQRFGDAKHVGKIVIAVQ